MNNWVFWVFAVLVSAIVAFGVTRKTYKDDQKMGISPPAQIMVKPKSCRELNHGYECLK